MLGAGASALLHAAVELRTGCAECGAGAAGLFALAPLQWRYSIQADVFGLSNFLAAAVLLATTRNFVYRRTFPASMVTAFICGLSLTNQHTCVFLVVPVAAAVLASGYPASEGSAFWRSVGLQCCRSMLLMLCGAVGLLPYLYLPFAAHRGALISWGECTSLQGFIRHITRAEYGSQLWYPACGPSHLHCAACMPAFAAGRHTFT